MFLYNFHFFNADFLEFMIIYNYANYYWAVFCLDIKVILYWRFWYISDDFLLSTLANVAKQNLWEYASQVGTAVIVSIFM